jgi:hypothetical protein
MLQVAAGRRVAAALAAASPIFYDRAFLLLHHQPAFAPDPYADLAPLPRSHGRSRPPGARGRAARSQRRSTRRRRSIRCPISASTGRTWPRIPTRRSPSRPDAGVADARPSAATASRSPGSTKRSKRALRPQFDPLSTLQQNRREPGQRRPDRPPAREDADLLGELLRALRLLRRFVRPGSSRAGRRRRDPGGARGRAGTALPLRRGEAARPRRSAGEDSAALREAFRSSRRSGRRRPR